MRWLVLALALSSAPARGELGVSVFGLSYHSDRSRDYNEVNPGIGVRWRGERGSYDLLAEAGSYRDSHRTQAVFAGAGAWLRLSGGWRVGGALSVFESVSYNGGRAFIAPTPIVAYEAGRLVLNLTYWPKLDGLNETNVLAAWITIWVQ